MSTESGFQGQANFWADAVKTLYVPTVRLFAAALSERLLPPFKELRPEADRLEEAEFKRLGSLPSFFEDDGSAIAEHAHDNAFTWYLTMKGVRQGVLNLHAVGLRHLFEQQLFDMCFYVGLSDRRRADYGKDIQSFRENGIPAEDFACWKDLEELRFLANAVKHAEGAGVNSLREMRPDLFVNPEMKDFEDLGKSLIVRQPLAGDDLYVQEADIARYAVAVEGFWAEVSNKLSAMVAA